MKPITNYVGTFLGAAALVGSSYFAGYTGGRTQGHNDIPVLLQQQIEYESGQLLNRQLSRDRSRGVEEFPPLTTPNLQSLIVARDELPRLPIYQK
ncbi:hypothetical protein HZB02_01560 [Candidatus Woesearchaeota archaeon]|nr:hypothetical protein [Candidatus Woesearchaeota archaeon]